MDSLKRLAASAVVPVVVLDDAKDAVATAKALLAGGVDVMEITFRTAAAADSIKAVAESCPDMLVGAGTVITLDQCRKAVECGAKFIVAPGFDEEVVRWCVENGVAVTPGCVLVPGTIYLGQMHEPIKDTKNPQSKLNAGIPFTETPNAIVFDYKMSGSSVFTP